MTRRSRTTPEKEIDPRVKEQRMEICGVLLMGLSALSAFSLVFTNTGVFVLVIREAVFAIFGRGGAVIPSVFLLVGGWHLLRWRKGPALTHRLFGFCILGLWSLVVLHLFSGAELGSDFTLASSAGGGWVGRTLAYLLVQAFSYNGTYLVLSIIFIISLILILDRPLVVLVKEIIRAFANKKAIIKSQVEAAPVVEVKPEPVKDRQVLRKEPMVYIPEPEPESPVIREQPVKAPSTGKVRTKADLHVIPGGQELPSLEILNSPSTRNRRGGASQPDQARQLEETLASFGVQARVIAIHQGPAITRYELQPAPGVKVSKIVNLSNDLALALAARGLRIEAPIPGKAAIGIEVPNSESRVVTLREILQNPSFGKSGKLGVALGIDIGGETIIADLGRMPHLLVAGATGSGKSVCINCIIMSLLFKAKPEEVKLIMIDPKMVELSVYNQIPHLSAPVVTEAKKASAVLRAVVTEMELRYKSFAERGVRDIDRYNQTLEPEENPLPYIVVIIDELADLMMIAPVEVEDAICRLAQMARATGIHLVVATQRPSVDVITGLIKANIPSRIAFAVSSQVDSRTILDGAGAEQLLGRGDMLYSPVGSLKPRRVQGALVTEEEIRHAVDFWKDRGTPEFDEAIANAEAHREEFREEEDELFWDAVRIVVEFGQASASVLQRRLRVGYTRAARLVDSMESRGFIGPHEGSKPRDVLITARQLEELRARINEKEG
jgi:S-DNA-T family DNA segregation ATPase FtsK/SpoIIIE